MSDSSKAVDLYLKKMKKHLSLPRSKRQAFMNGLRQELLEYCALHPACTYEELVDAFGDPQDTAREFIEDSDLVENQKAEHRKRILLWAVIALLAVVCITLGALYYDMYMHTEDVGGIVVIYEGPVEIIEE